MESEVEDTTVSKAIVVGHGAVNGMSVEASSSLSQLSSSGQTQSRYVDDANRRGIVVAARYSTDIMHVHEETLKGVLGG